MTDKAAIRNVIAEGHSCGNDLRRVKRSVHKELRKKAVQEGFEK